jgi:DNA-binding transcriptional LysR family regulator
MDRFSALQLFVRVVDSGSFTKAAREFGIGQPAVSKQIAALEARLGTALLNRTSRGLHPTAAGHQFYDLAIRVLADLDDGESRIGRGSVSPTGTIRAAIPPALGPRYIVPRLPAFLAAYPDIAVELSVSERQVDLIGEGIDVALRIGALDDSRLAVRRIGSLPTSTVATPDYLARHGTPADPAALRDHALIAVRLHGAPLAWRFKGEDGGFAFDPAGRITVNDAENVRAAVLAGLGIAHDSTALFEADLRAGTVVAILADFAPDPPPIQAVCPTGRRMPQRLRLFIDFLAEMCAAEPSLRLG